MDNREKHIGEVLAACKNHWRSSGVPEYEVWMLGEEVEEELRHTVENDGTVEETVGPDVGAFARSWVEVPQPETQKDRLGVGIFVTVLFIVVAVLVALRLDNWFSLPWYLVAVLATAGAAILLFWVGRSR